MSNDKIKDFVEKQKKFAEEFENKQKSKGTEPSLKDITSHFKKGREEVVFGDRTFIIKKFGIRDTITLVPILGNSFLVPASACLKGGEAEEGIGGLTEALMLLFQGMEGGQFIDLMELVLSNTTINGKSVDIDNDFEDIGEILKLCVKVLEQSFSPFLKSLDLSRMTEWFQKISLLQQ